jgi:hypothetical protein
MTNTGPSYGPHKQGPCSVVMLLHHRQSLIPTASYLLPPPHRDRQSLHVKVAHDRFWRQRQASKGSVLLMEIKAV